MVVAAFDDGEAGMKETMGNAFVPGSVALSEEETEMIARRERLLGPAYRLFMQGPCRWCGERARISMMQRETPI